MSISGSGMPRPSSSFSASGTSGSFLKPKFSTTCQQSWPRLSIWMRLFSPTQGTSWWRTATNRLYSCSTLLCLRLCSKALGVRSTSADRNTAVPGTRSGGLMKIASRKPVRSMASSRRLAAISLRPCIQVSISVNMPMPMTMGNQPPPTSLSMLLAKKVKSMTKKKPVASKQGSSSG